MKRRVIKKAEMFTLVDKVCELQKTIDEYERFLGDLLIMLVKGEPQIVVKHKIDYPADWIWDECHKLIKENMELKGKLAQNLQEK